VNCAAGLVWGGGRTGGDLAGLGRVAGPVAVLPDTNHQNN